MGKRRERERGGNKQWRSGAGSSGKDGAASVGIGLAVRGLHWDSEQLKNSISVAKKIKIRGPAAIKMAGECALVEAVGGNYSLHTF